MRNIVVYMTLTFSLSTQVNAQNFYAAIGWGYYKNSFSFPVTSGLNVVYQTKPQGSVGYMLSDNISAELGINQFSWTYSQEDFWYISIRMLRLMPSLKYSHYFGETVSGYVKVGICIGVDNFMRQDFKSVKDLPPYTIQISKTEYKGGLAPGYVFAVGGECKIYRNLNLYAELIGMYNYWSRSDKVNIIELTGYSDEVIDRTPMKVHAGGAHVGLKYSFW